MKFWEVAVKFNLISSVVFGEEYTSVYKLLKLLEIFTWLYFIKKLLICIVFCRLQNESW